MDKISTESRSRNMASIRSKNTSPEIKVRKALHALGFRFRLHDTALPGRPDIVLPRYNTVIEVFGCFWHRHSCINGSRPKTNSAYWEEKISNNAKRDARNKRKIIGLGWRYIRLWECQVEKDTLQVISGIASTLKGT